MTLYGLNLSLAPAPGRRVYAFLIPTGFPDDVLRRLPRVQREPLAVGRGGPVEMVLSIIDTITGEARPLSVFITWEPYDSIVAAATDHLASCGSRGVYVALGHIVYFVSA